MNDGKVKRKKKFWLFGRKEKKGGREKLKEKNEMVQLIFFLSLI